jgi:uncharacterized protein with PQ loop repeat
MFIIYNPNLNILGFYLTLLFVSVCLFAIGSILDNNCKIDYKKLDDKDLKVGITLKFCSTIIILLVSLLFIMNILYTLITNYLI